MTLLCLTKNRRRWLPQAIACFQRQTHKDAELLILADGEDVRDLLPADDSRVRLIHLERPLNVGDKRNFGCERAAGHVIATKMVFLSPHLNPAISKSSTAMQSPSLPGSKR